MAKEKKTMKNAFEEVLNILNETTPHKEEPVDLDVVVERLETALDKLNEQMETIYRQTGMTKEQLEAFSANPSNFTKEEWALLSQIRGELRKFQEKSDKSMGQLVHGGTAHGVPQTASQGEGKKKQRPPKKGWIKE